MGAAAVSLEAFLASHKVRECHTGRSAQAQNRGDENAKPTNGSSKKETVRFRGSGPVTQKRRKIVKVVRVGLCALKHHSTRQLS